MDVPSINKFLMDVIRDEEGGISANEARGVSRTLARRGQRPATGGAMTF